MNLFIYFHAYLVTSGSVSMYYLSTVMLAYYHKCTYTQSAGIKFVNLQRFGLLFTRRPPHSHRRYRASFNSLHTRNTIHTFGRAETDK